VAERPGTPEVLLVQQVRLKPGGRPVDLVIRSGEIVGLAGLEGNGQEKFLRVLAGLSRPPGGRVVVMAGEAEQAVTDHESAARYGAVYLPRDRKTEGIFSSLPVLDNFAVASLARSSHAGILRRRDLLARFERARHRLHIVASSPRHPITSLSGGNQQKVMLARALELGSRVLLLNDPTRGVDAAAKHGFHEIFRRLAKEDGAALVILSTELTELVNLCDRVLVFYASELEAEYRRPFTEQALLAAMFGRSRDAVSGAGATEPEAPALEASGSGATSAGKGAQGSRGDGPVREVGL
jgi:ribose transport system ATP-binding protein